MGDLNEPPDLNKRIIQTKIEVPDNFYKKWILASNKDKISEEDLEKDYDKYIEELKWTLIVNKIAEDNDIKVEHAHVMENAKATITDQFSAYGMGDSLGEQLDSFAENYLQGNDGQNYMNTFNKVRGDRIMDFVSEKMDISSKKVKPEEFSKIVSN